MVVNLSIIIYQSINQSRDQSSNRIIRGKGLKRRLASCPTCHHPLPPHYHWTTSQSLLPSSFAMSTATSVTPSSLYEKHTHTPFTQYSYSLTITVIAPLGFFYFSPIILLFPSLSFFIPSFSQCFFSVQLI